MIEGKTNYVDAEIVKAKIKQIIGGVSGLDANRIQDDDDFNTDLNLDSLWLIQIGVEVNMAFKLDLPDARFYSVSSVSAATALVLDRRKELDALEQANLTPPA